MLQHRADPSSLRLEATGSRDECPDPIHRAARATANRWVPEQVGVWSQYPDGLLEVQQWLCHHVVVTFAAVRGAGVMVRFRGAPFPLTWTAPWVRALHRAEIQTGAGPGLRAMDTQRIVGCTRNDLAKAFPPLSASFADADVGAVRAEPLPVASRAVGVLTLYGANGRAVRTSSNRLSPVKTRLVTALSAYCAAHYHEDHAIRLRRELERQQLLDQAAAILRTRHRISAEAARALLAERAAGGNVSVSTAARAVVRQHLAAEQQSCRRSQAGGRSN